MNTKVTLFAALLALSVFHSSAFEIVQNDEGEQYYLVPLEAQLPLLQRQRRDTIYDARKTGAGTSLSLGHKGTIFENDKHRLDGHAYGQQTFKHWKPVGPGTVGGGLDYSHIPSGSGLSVSGTHTKGFGTGLEAAGNANLWRHGNSRLDAVGTYSQHFGGPGGRGRPNTYGGLNFQHRF